ncbi:MAG: YceD family protein [Eubacteriales bacterium]
MVIDLNPMLRGEISKIDIDFVLTPEIIEDVSFDGGARVYGKITNSAGYMRLTLRADLPYVGECARCLDEVRGTFSLDFERTVVTEGMVSEEKLEESADEYIVIEDGKLELDDAVREELLIDFPRKLLCRDDCKGLCPRCGKRLNEGECGCTTKEIDPRLAVLKKYLDK